jgi:hypothetical protein
MAVLLDSSTLILFNIYLVMALQLAFNWNATNCNSNSAFFQLGFIVLMLARLIGHELYNNRKAGRVCHAFVMFLFSGLLLALGIVQAITVFSNPNDFNYDRATKQGSEVCFQNRIVFVSEIVIIGLTVLKDVYFILLTKDEIAEG